MIECSGCGAYLRFDIASQKLKCDHCDSEYNVDEINNLRSASGSEAEPSKIEMYSFECPQCGGIIYGDRQDMTGFCSYCGTPVELAGRLTEIERPGSVIPFRKTKDDCKEIFMKMTRFNPFLPAGYKDREHIDSFRGIYMPYFTYHVNYNGEFNVNADGKSRRRGDYIYTDTYNVNGFLRGEYLGFEHDSSTTFDDNISEALGPYITGERLKFNPGYLSGFYADASDENPDSYSNNARETANVMVEDKIIPLTKAQNRKIRITGKKYIPQTSTNVTAEKAMYPVWFMSYKNGDRVAYAAVNGQTGKITADLPVDFKKFLMFSLITAVPLFFLLNLVTFFTPNTMLAIYSALCVVCTIMLNKHTKKIMIHDNIISRSSDVRKKEKEKKKIRFPFFILIILVLFPAIMFMRVLLTFAGSMMLSGGGMIPNLMAVSLNVTSMFYLAAFIVNIIYSVLITLKFKRLKEAGVSLKGMFSAYLSAAAIFASFIISFMDVASDLWYYSGCLAILVCILLELLMIVLNHNYLATRRPVQFNKEGGDDRA